MKDVKGTYVLEIPNNPSGLDFIEKFRRYKRNGYRLRLRGRGSRVGCTNYCRDLPLEKAEKFVGYVDKITPKKTMVQESPWDKREEFMLNEINNLKEELCQKEDKLREALINIEIYKDKYSDVDRAYDRLDNRLNEEIVKLKEIIVYLANELTRRI